jgi:hypothetical protein
MRKKIISIIILSFFALLLTGVKAQAEANFLATPELTAEEFDSGKTYFEQRVEADQTYDFKVGLFNNSDSEMKLKVNFEDASVNENGVLEYGKKQAKNSLVSLASGASEVSVEDYDSAVYSFQVKMPKASFDGEIFGAVSFQQVNAVGDNIGDPVKIALKLREGDLDKKANFALKKVSAEYNFLQPKKGAKINLFVENKADISYSSLEYTVRVSDEKGHEMVLAKRPNVQATPTSSYTQSFEWKDFNWQKQGKETYLLEVELVDKDGDGRWTFAQKFKVNMINKPKVVDVLLIGLFILMATLLICNTLILNDKRKMKKNVNSFR